MSRLSRFLFLLIAGCSFFSCDRDKKKESSNHLLNASSPYLRDHADNPVDWYEWSEEALAKAKSEGKPIIISIGYAACHWCHVMEEETFMDTAVARMMNQYFVSIKIDREERPDIDQIYVDASQLINGNAGWPLNAFALPGGEPFHVGTYYPKQQWIRLLKQIKETYDSDYNRLQRQADAITKGIRTAEVIIENTDSSLVTRESYSKTFASLLSHLDQSAGGVRGSPKFPLPAIDEYLLQNYYLTRNDVALKQVTTALDAMQQGGIYDHLEGGFARYTTDSLWRVPHFERMLYDNAQLVSLYSKAYQVTNNQEYATTVNATLEFIKSKMTSADGGFYSSMNADSEGEEGKYYVWTHDELKGILDKNTFDLVVAYYNVTTEGNWEKSKNVLYTTMSDQDFARQHQLPIDQLKTRIQQARTILLTDRNKRMSPTIDDKKLTSWNALMIRGYLAAHNAFQNAEYLEIALANAKFIATERVDSNGHVWRNKSGDHTIEGFLDDYAMMALSFIELYQTTFDIQWLAKARTITDFAITHFNDSKNSLFFYTMNDSKSLIVRKKEVTDGVIASSNSVLAEALFLLGEYYDQENYKSLFRNMMNQMAPLIKDDIDYSNWHRLEGWIAYPPFEVAIVGPNALKVSQELRKAFLPTMVLMGGDKGNLPLLENKSVDGKTMIYVCKNRTCRLPVESVEQALRQIVAR